MELELELEPDAEVELVASDVVDEVSSPVVVVSLPLVVEPLEVSGPLVVSSVPVPLAVPDVVSELAVPLESESDPDAAVGSEAEPEAWLADPVPVGPLVAPPLEPSSPEPTKSEQPPATSHTTPKAPTSHRQPIA